MPPLPQPEPPKPLPPRWVPTPDPQDIQVPGLDTSAPVAEQIEQIEQLITIKLQNMDENFAAIHHLITTRLLPAIKRYSVASEPIREAARFWISFFQASAQVRMRMDGDFTGTDASNERTPTATETDTQETSQEGAGDGQSFHTAQNDLSFQPPPTSSTPLLSRSQVAATTGPTPDSSWAASIESPFARLDRQMSSLRLDEPSASKPGTSQPRPVPPRSILKPPSKDFHFTETSESSATPYSPILRPRQPAVADTTASSTSTSTSGILVRPVLVPPSSNAKGKSTPLRENIFRRNLLLSAAAPPSASSASGSTPRRPIPSPKKKNPWSAQKQWSGIVDLREPQPDESSDDEDALPDGMSPPVTMRFTRPSDVRLSRAPADRVSRGFIAESARKSVGATLRVPMSGTPGRRRPKRDRVDGSMFDPAGTSSSSAASLGMPRTPGLQGFANYGALFDDQGLGHGADDGDDEDSFWNADDGAHLDANQPRMSGSFSDDDSDDDFAGGVPVTGSGFESSYEGGAGNEATDTVFGARFAGGRDAASLRIHGTELLAETVDPAATDEAVPAVEQSPTPWAGRKPDYEFNVHD